MSQRSNECKAMSNELGNSRMNHHEPGLTKDDENNPPTPPLEKGGQGGFERGFSGEN